MAHWKPVDQMQDLVNKMGGEEGIKRFLSGELKLVLVDQPPLLTSVTTTSMSAITKFSAKQTFGAKKPAITLWYLGDTFKEKMLGKVEHDISATTLTAQALTRDSLDAPILAELGDRAEIFLAHVWDLLTKQANGESGILLTNGYANIFYVRGTDGNLWAVSAHWHAGCGWRVDAHSVERPSGWYAGGQVFSR